MRDKLVKSERFCSYISLHHRDELMKELLECERNMNDSEFMWLIAFLVDAYEEHCHHEKRVFYVDHGTTACYRKRKCDKTVTKILKRCISHFRENTLVKRREERAWEGKEA